MASCAQVVSPTGGLRDETPPKIIQSIPENETINFKGNKIMIEFDEFAILKDLKDNLLVSPTPKIFTRCSSRKANDWRLKLRIHF